MMAKISFKVEQPILKGRRRAGIPSSHTPTQALFCLFVFLNRVTNSQESSCQGQTSSQLHPFLPQESSHPHKHVHKTHYHLPGECKTLLTCPEKWHKSAQPHSSSVLGLDQWCQTNPVKGRCGCRFSFQPSKNTPDLNQVCFIPTKQEHSWFGSGVLLLGWNENLQPQWPFTGSVWHYWSRLTDAVRQAVSAPNGGKRKAGGVFKLVKTGWCLTPIT